MISTYPERAKARNLRRDPAATVLVMSDEFDGPWVQVDGTAEVLDMPSQEAEDGLVDYFRCIAGEHDDWDEYREAMRRQGKSLIRITRRVVGPGRDRRLPARHGQRMTLVAAADGSALGNPGPAGWAWYVDDDCWASGGWPHGTNNMGELTAVLDLLQQTAEVDDDLLVYCDSTYAINSIPSGCRAGSGAAGRRATASRSPTSRS